MHTRIVIPDDDLREKRSNMFISLGQNNEYSQGLWSDDKRKTLKVIAYKRNILEEMKEG